MAVFGGGGLEKLKVPLIQQYAHFEELTIANVFRLTGDELT